MLPPFPQHLTLSLSQRLYFRPALSQSKNRWVIFLSELKNLGDPEQCNTAEMLQAPTFFCSGYSTTWPPLSIQMCIQMCMCTYNQTKYCVSVRLRDVCKADLLPSGSQNVSLSQQHHHYQEHVINTNSQPLTLISESESLAVGSRNLSLTALQLIQAYTSFSRSSNKTPWEGWVSFNLFSQDP